MKSVTNEKRKRKKVFPDVVFELTLFAATAFVTSVMEEKEIKVVVFTNVAFELSLPEHL